MKNSMEFTQKVKNRTTIWYSSSTSGYVSKGNESLPWRDIWIPVFIAALCTIAPWTANSRRYNQSIPKEINPEHSLEGLNTEAPVLWLPGAKSQLIGKGPVTEKDWGQEEKGATEDEMIEWRHWLNGHESEQTLGDGEGQGDLASCNSGVRKESDTT